MACHAKGRGFDSRRSRKTRVIKNILLSADYLILHVVFYFRYPLNKAVSVLLLYPSYPVYSKTKVLLSLIRLVQCKLFLIGKTEERGNPRSHQTSPDPTRPHQIPPGVTRSRSAHFAAGPGFEVRRSRVTLLSKCCSQCYPYFSSWISPV